MFLLEAGEVIPCGLDEGLPRVAREVVVDEGVEVL